MNLAHGTFLFFVAVAAGALNSVAGGGGFLCFPALVFTGMPPINANATNTAALWPGTAASVAAYRGVISGHRRILIPVAVSGIIGGLIGANVLLRIPQATFMKMVPWLLLTATLLFVFSGPITRWTGRFIAEGSSPTRKAVIGGMIIQLCIALYIGFFGAGAGILMMALFAGAIMWPQAALMIVGAAVGGYGGAWYAQKLPPRYVRWFAIATGFAMTAYFFWRTRS